MQQCHLDVFTRLRISPETLLRVLASLQHPGIDLAICRSAIRPRRNAAELQFMRNLVLIKDSTEAQGAVRPAIRNAAARNSRALEQQVECSELDGPTHSTWRCSVVT
jgi:hypothetical protein